MKPQRPIADNNTRYGCLPCWHSAIPSRGQLSDIRCRLGFETSLGRRCGKFEATDGRVRRDD